VSSPPYRLGRFTCGLDNTDIRRRADSTGKLAMPLLPSTSLCLFSFPFPGALFLVSRGDFLMFIERSLLLPASTIVPEYPFFDFQVSVLHLLIGDDENPPD
jgi:hypothetical protein